MQWSSLEELHCWGVMVAPPQCHQQKGWKVPPPPWWPASARESAWLVSGPAWALCWPHSCVLICHPYVTLAGMVANLAQLSYHSHSHICESRLVQLGWALRSGAKPPCRNTFRSPSWRSWSPSSPDIIPLATNQLPQLIMYSSSRCM